MPEPLTDEEIAVIERAAGTNVTMTTTREAVGEFTNRLLATIRQRTQERDEAVALLRRASADVTFAAMVANDGDWWALDTEIDALLATLTDTT